MTTSPSFEFYYVYFKALVPDLARLPQRQADSTSDSQICGNVSCSPFRIEPEIVSEDDIVEVEAE